MTDKDCKETDEMITKLKKEKERELALKKFKERGGKIEKLKPQRITAQMKRDNRI